MKYGSSNEDRLLQIKYGCSNENPNDGTEEPPRIRLREHLFFFSCHWGQGFL
jgi:hypothetical protein